jgi:hypothetical protein
MSRSILRLQYLNFQASLTVLVPQPGESSCCLRR